VELLIGCAVLLLAVGCAGMRSESSKEQGHTEATKKEQTHSPGATAAEETTVLQSEGDRKRPPESTLSYGGREVRSPPLDVMCWVTWGPRTACLVDSGGGAPGEPPPKKKLYVPSGSEMVFHYEAPRPPDKVTAYARTFLGVTLYDAAKVGSHQYRLEFHGSGVERTIPAQLPPREYLVYVSVDDPQGAISYTFRIMVQ
jgi:hypothetical protein